MNYIKFYKKQLKVDFNSSEYEVHHIDGNKKNNDINNLVLLPKSLHKRFHGLQAQLSSFKTPFKMDDFVSVPLMSFDLYSYFYYKRDILYCIRYKERKLNNEIDNEEYFKILEVFHVL